MFAINRIYIHVLLVTIASQLLRLKIKQKVKKEDIASV